LRVRHVVAALNRGGSRAAAHGTAEQPCQEAGACTNNSTAASVSGGRSDQCSSRSSDAGPDRRTVSLRRGEYAINEPGTWHTADVSGSATAVFITAGLGTQHRAR